MQTAAKRALFHLRDGWFFGRGEGGVVLIEKRRRADPDAPLDLLLVLPGEEWCSIVAAVSAAGAVAESFAQACELHLGPEGERQ